MYSGRIGKNLRFFILSRTISIGLYVTALSSIANIRMSEGAIRRCYQEAILSVPVNIASPDPQEQIEYKELQQIINRTLEKLPERRLHIFRLHHTEGKKYSEIASLLSLSVKTVEKEMTRALRTLRKEIENYIQIS